MRIYVIVFITIFQIITIPWLNCQSNFKSGYVITQQSDTLYGLVDSRTESRNSEICSFKRSLEADIQEFTPSEIYAYRIQDGKYYLSITIPVDGKEKLVFAEYLLNGIVKLYFYKDGSYNHYYIEKSDGRIIELTNAKKEVKVEGRRYNFENKRYIGVLKVAFSDCPEVLKDVERATLEHQSLIGLSKEYHELTCRPGEECIIYEKIIPPVVLKISPVFNLNISQGYFEDQSIWYDGVKEESKTTSTFYPSAGISLDFILPQWNERYILNVSSEVGYFQFTSHGVRREGISDTYKDIILKTPFFKNTAGIKYVYPGIKLQPSFFLGYSSLLMYNSTTDYSFTVVTKVIQPQRVDYYPNQSVKLPFYYHGISAGIGTKLTFSRKLTVYYSVLLNQHSNSVELIRTYNKPNLRFKSIILSTKFIF